MPWEIEFDALQHITQLPDGSVAIHELAESPETGQNVLIKATGIYIRKDTTNLVAIESGKISFLDGQGYMSVSEESPLGEKMPVLDIYADTKRALNIYSAGEAGVRVIANSNDLKNSSAIVLAPNAATIYVGDGSDDQAGSGGFMAMNGITGVVDWRNINAFRINGIPIPIL